MFGIVNPALVAHIRAINAQVHAVEGHIHQTGGGLHHGARRRWDGLPPAPAGQVRIKLVQPTSSGGFNTNRRRAHRPSSPQSSLDIGDIGQGHR